MSKKINIFVGNVGSAYIDKETAQKNVTIAQQNIIDCDAIIEKANNLITKINAAKVTANQAKEEADAVKSILDNVIVEYSNNTTKLNKLNALKNELINNDTDGIALNGGNVRTANSNITNLNRQLVETQSILEDALNLKEDNEKLLLTRQEELTTSTNEFNSYMPEPSQEDQSNTIEGELNHRIDEVESNIDIANETSQAINDVTQDVYNKINEITSESDENEDIVLRKLYWYAGQRQLNTDVFEVTENDCTENIVDTWHVLTIKKINDNHFIIAGIDSNSDVTTWNVIVPKDLNFTPVKADLVERDTNWVPIKQVTVNDTPSILYEVNNEVSKLTTSPVKRLNILMSTDEIIEPEPEPTGETGEPTPTGETGEPTPQPDLTAKGYWYVGLTAPTQPYLDAIAANLITDGSEAPGWRKIENEFNTYSRLNPLYNPYEGIDFGLDDESRFYIVLPSGFIIVDASGYNPIAANDPRFMNYNQIVINGVNYNVYSSTGYGFGYSVIFNGGSIKPEPTGEEPEPTYNIVFKDGDEIIKTVTGVTGTYVSAPNMEKEGYTFNGWSINGETAILPVNTIGESDITYIALWIEEEPTGEEPTGEEPTGEEPTGEEPTGEEPTGETGEPTGEEPTGETGEPTGEEPTGEEPTGEHISGENVVFTEQPTIESIIEQFGDNPVKPVEPQALNMNSLTKQTSMYLTFPMSWLVFDENENLVKPKITNSLGFELGYEITDSIEVNGIEYGIFDVTFNKDTYTIEF